MDTPPVIPLDTQLRMALIKENHLSAEYAYMRGIVASHEREIAILSLSVVMLLCVNYYLIMKMHKIERAANE